MLLVRFRGVRCHAALLSGREHDVPVTRALFGHLFPVETLPLGDCALRALRLKAGECWVLAG